MTIGGTNGNGGGAGDYTGGGGGITGNGTSSVNAANSGGLSFTNGGLGGDSANQRVGGFGGGGGTLSSISGGGGGGGYSGGAGVSKALNPYSAGGGGGSYAISTMTLNGYNTNHGALYVTANFPLNDINQPSLSWSNITKNFGESAFPITPPTTNSSGTITYTSSNPTVSKVSNPRNALNFDGVDDAINFGVPDWTYSTQFRTTMTIECWFKTTDTNNQDPTANFVSRWITGGVNAQFMFFMNASGQVGFWADGVGSVQSTLSYKDTQWHHAAVTFNSGVFNLYIDGVNIQTSTHTTNLLNNNSTIRLIIGNDDAGYIDQYNNTDRQFRGSIADVRIWNVVRTPTEIFNNYAIQLIGNETGLLFYNKLDQGTVGANNSGITTTTNNMLSGGNTGTLVNFALSGTTSNWVAGPEPRITILSAGTSLITANQAASGSYASGYAIATLTVSPIAPTVSMSNITKSRADGAVPLVGLLSPTSNSLISYGSIWNKLGADIDGEATGDQSGYSVSVSADGTVVAIGAVGNDANGTDSGHVRVYKYDPSKTTAVTDQSSANFGPVGWRRLGADIDGEATYDQSGRSVSVSADGTVVAIGALGNDANGTNSGHVRVYKYDLSKTTAETDQSNVNFGPVGWRRLGADIDGEAVSDQSGYSVSVSADGTVVAIGAYTNDGGNGADSGHVRVYKYDSLKTTAVTDQSSANFGPVGWRRLGADIDGEAASDLSGHSVSLSSDGTVVAIGAHGNDVNGTESGHVRVYKYDISKTTAVTDQSNANFGPVGWRRLGADIDGEATNDLSGYTVSLSADGNVVAIGANGNDANGTNSGHVRVYKYDLSKTTAVTDQSNANFGPVGWIRLGADIDGEADFDYSGYNVSISADGTVVAIGAYFNDGTTGNVNDTRGHVRVYKYDPSKTTAETDQSSANFGPVGWRRLGMDIDGEIAGDQSGSVSLSADGTVVAIGALDNDGKYSNTVPNAFYVRTGGSNWRDYIPLLVADTTTNIQIWGGPDAQWFDVTYGPGNEIAKQYSYFAGYWLQANQAVVGTTFQVESFCSNGSQLVSRGIFTFTATAVSNGLVTAYTGRLSNYDNNTYALTPQSDGITAGSTALASNSGHVRVYKIDSYGNYSYTSQNAAVAEVYGSIVVMRGVGTAQINVTQSASSNYTSGTTTTSLTITTIPPIFTWANITKNFSLGTLIISGENAPITNSNGKITYTNNSDTSTATIADAGSDIYDSVVVTLPSGRKAINTLLGKNLQRLFRYVGSSISATDFHTACDGQGPTLTVVKAANGAIALAFASVSWDSDTTWRSAPSGSCWLCPFQTSPTSTPNTTRYYNSISPQHSINGHPSYGPIFGTGHDFVIAPGGLQSYTNPNSYETPPNGLFNNGTGYQTYTLASVEVYKLKNEPLITFLKAGTVTLTASIEASGDYISSTVNTQLTILETTISGTNNNVSLPYNGSSQTATVISNVLPNGATYTGSLTATGTNIGTYTSTITGTSPYTGTFSGTLTITAILSTFTWHTSAITKTYLDADFPLDTPTNANSQGAFTYTSNDSTVASVNINTGVVTIGIVGSATITITQAANGNYLQTTKTVVIDVARAEPGITNWNAVVKNLGDASFLITPPTTNSPGALTYSSTDNTVALVSNSEIYNSVVVTLPSAKTAIHNLIAQDLKLLFRYVGANISSSDFHTACDNQGPTLTVVKATNGAIALAYSSVNWTSVGGYVSATSGSNWLCPFQTSDTATPNTTRYYNSISPQYSINDIPSYGPLFGNGYDLAIHYTISSTTPSAYQTPPNGLFNNGIGGQYFTLASIEVYRLGSISPTVNIFNSGTIKLRVDQAQTANFTSKFVEANFTVNAASPSTLSNFSSITRLISDGSFLMPPPTSNSGSRYGSLWKKLGNNINCNEYLYENNGPITSLITTNNFPVLNSLTNWEMSIRFTLTGGSSYRPLIGSMYNNVDTRGWGIWIGPDNQIHYADTVTGYNFFTGQVSNNIPYILNVIKVGTNYTFRLFNISTQALLTNSITTTDALGVGPVDIYGFSNGERFVGTISYVQVFNYFEKTNFISVSMSADGSTVATGGYDNNGYVSVFQYNGSNWVQLGNNIIHQASGDNSGYSVKLSANGKVLAIGALNNDINGSNSGLVRVYQWNGSAWVKLGGDILGEFAGDQSGASVDLSGDGTTIVIGATGNDGNGNNSGHARVYKYDLTKTTSDTDQSSINFGPIGWRRLGADIDGETSADFSGTSVRISLEGSIIAIGSQFNSGNGANSGSVRVYKYNVSKSAANNLGPAGWDKLGADIDGEATNDNSGYSVSLSADGSIVAIGAINNDGNGNNSGNVRVYKYDETKTTSDTNQSSINYGPIGWRRLGADIDGEAANDKSGFSVSLSADGAVIAISANENDLTNSDNRGHVRVYKYNSLKTIADRLGPIGWNRIGADIDGEVSLENSGYITSLSSDGLTIAVGVPFNTTNLGSRGCVRVYKIDTYGSFSYTSNLTGVAEVYGSIVLMKSSNTTNITATQSANVSTYLYPYTSHTFTNAGLTGKNGPTLTQIRNAYASTSWSSNNLYLNMKTQGYQLWTVPATGVYELTLAGAAGNGCLVDNNTQPGGRGAVISMRVELVQGQQIGIIVGQKGIGASSTLETNIGSAGGGGSFVWDASNTDYLIGAAGGGGGASFWEATAYAGADATYTTTGGSTNGGQTITGGVNGNGGNITSTGNLFYAGAGSGWLTSGQSNTSSSNNAGGGQTFSNGFIGGEGGSNGTTISGQGGFGGGGGGYNVVGGGGGGYSGGGAAGATGTPSSIAGGGGGGSYFSGTNFTNVGYNTDSGYVTITSLISNYGSNTIVRSLIIDDVNSPNLVFDTFATTVNFGSSSFTISATSNSEGAITYSTNDPSVATITNGNTVNIIEAGTVDIIATQVANALYASKIIGIELTVSPIAPQIVASNINKVYGNQPFRVTATSPNSTGTFSYSSNDTSIATVSDTNLITIVAHGTTSIRATISATRNYASDYYDIPLFVDRADPEINIDAQYLNVAFNDIDYDIISTSNSGGLRTYASSNINVVSVTSNNSIGTVTIKKAGVTTITVSQLQFENYKAISTDFTLTVSTTLPTVSGFDTLNKNYQDADFILPFPSSSSSIGEYSYVTVPSSSDVLTITAPPAAFTLSNISVPDTSLTNFPSLHQLVNWRLVIDFRLNTQSGANTTRALIGSMYNNTDTTSGWGLWVSNENKLVWSWQQNTYNTDFVLLSNINYTIIVKKQSENINFILRNLVTGIEIIVTTSIASNTMGQGPVTVGGWINNTDENFDGVISNVYARNTSYIAQTGQVGQIQIKVIVEASGNYTSREVVATFNLLPISPGINSFGPLTKNYKGETFTITATSNSDGAYTYTSTNTGVAAIGISTGQVVIGVAGTTTIRATQAATRNYISTFKDETLTVQKILPTFNFFNSINKNYTDSAFDVSVSLASNSQDSTGAITYSSSNTSVANFLINIGISVYNGLYILDGNTSNTNPTINLIRGFTYRFNVNASGHPFWIKTALGTGTENQYNIGITNNGTTSGIIQFTVATDAPSTLYYNCQFHGSMQGTINISNSGTSSGTSTNTVIVGNAGSTTITATQATSDNYLEGTVSTTLTVDPILPTFNPLNQINKIYLNAPFPVSATSNSQGTITYSIINDTTIASVVSSNSVGTVTILKAGTTTIKATQAALGNYIQNEITTTLFVDRAIPTWQSYTIPSAPYGNAPYQINNPISNSDAPFEFTNSSNPEVASITTSGIVTLHSLGTTTISVQQLLNNNFVSKSGSATLTVTIGTPQISTLALPYTILDNPPFVIPFPASNAPTSYGTWAKIGGNINGERLGDLSGWAVSLSADGNIVAIGATDNTGQGSKTLSGHVRVYRRNPSKLASNTLGPIGWDRIGADIDGEFANTRSGWSVKLSADGNVVVIGAPFNDGTTGVSTDNRGSVRVYRLSVSVINNVTTEVWNKLGDDIDGLSAEDLSGSSVDISADGSIIAIGSPETNLVNESAVLKGKVRVLKYSGSAWSQLGSNIDGLFDYEQFGTSVSLSADGKILACGAKNNSTNGDNSGETRVYSYINNDWVQYGQSINGEAADDNSGYSISLSADGKTLAIGAPNNNLSEESYSNGNVRVFRYNLANNQNPWQQIGNTIYGEAAFDYSGSSVSVSADGNIVVIGSPSNDGTTNNPEDNRGSVRVYNYANNQWVKMGDDIDGETTGDKCGQSVSISSNGRIIAIGSPYKNGSGSQSGHVRVYSVNSEGTFTFTSSNPSIVSVYGTIAFVNLDGTCTITTAQTGVTNYFVSTTRDTVFTVGLKSPSIDPLVLSTPKTYGDQDFQITQPTSNSTGAFSYVSLDQNIATVNGNTITIVKAGSVVIRAIQASQPHNYAAAYVEATLVINKANPNLDAFAIVSKVYLDSPFSITPPTSIGPGSFVYTSNLEIVSINGSAITINAAGTCTITATKQETDNYLSSIISATLVIQKANPTLSFFIPFKRVGDPNFTLNANSNNTQTAITYTTTDSSIVSIDGTTASIHSGGFVNITGSQVETSNFNSSSISYTLIVIGLDAEYPNQILNGLNLSNANLFSANFNNASMIGANLINANLFDCNLENTNMTNTLLSGVISGNIRGTPILPVNYNLIDGYIIGPNVNLNSAYLVNSNLSTRDLIGANLFNSNLFTANLSSISINSTTDFRNANLKDVISENINGVTSLFSNNINIINGRILITPTITQNNVTNKTFKDVPFDITSPVSDSVAPFTYQSSDTNVASVSGSTITINNQGTTTITATQEAQSNYTSGIIQWTLNVARVLPIIQPFIIPSVLFGTVTTSITAPVSESQGQFSYTILEPEIATVNGTVITINRGGSCTVQATQSLDGNFLSRMVSTTFTINPILPTIGTFTVPSSQYLAQPFRITSPSTNSEGAITYESNNTNIATITDVNLINIHAAGTCKITLIQAATFNHLSRSVEATLTVNKIAPQIGNLILPANKKFGYVDFTITEPTTNSTGAFTYSSSNESVVTITGSTVTIHSAGSSTITATQATDNNYTQLSVNAVLTILEQTDVLREFIIDVKQLGDDPFTITPPSTFRPGNFSYVSSDENVATIAGDEITIVGAGITYITATQEPNGLYNEISITSIFAVLDPANPLELNNVNLSNIRFVNGNLSGMRILNSNLAYANISDAFLFNTTIIDSEVTHVNLFNSNLTNATIENSNLSYSFITNVDLTNTNLTGCKLTGITSENIIGTPTLPSDYILQNGYIIGPSVLLDNANLNNANIFSANLTNVDLTTASLLNIISGNIKGASQLPTNYTIVNGYIIGPSVNLNNGNLGDTDLSNLNLSNSNLLYANLVNANLQNTNLNGCNFFGVKSGNIRGVPLLPLDYLLVGGYIVGPEVSLINANLKYANLFGANLTNVNLLTAQLEFITSGNIKGQPELLTGYSLLNGYIVGPNVMLQHATLVNSDLSNLNLLSSNLFNANLYSSDLSSTNLSNCNINGIVSGNITGTPLLPFNYSMINSYILGPSVILNDANLSYANLFAVNLTNVDLTTANLHYISSGSIIGNPQLQSGFGVINGYILGPNVLLQHASLQGQTMNSINLMGANLHSANLYGATFNSITIDENTDLLNADLRNVVSENMVGTTTKLSNNVQIINGSVKITPTIANLVVSNKTYGDSAFNITDPVSDSLGIINYISSNSFVASISNRNTITIVSAGNTVISGTQGIYTNYLEGTVNVDFSVSKRVSTLGNLSLSAKLYTDPPFNLTDPTTNSTGAFVYTSGNVSVATINGNTVTLLGVGQSVIHAKQLADNNNFENFVEATLHVAVGPPTIQPITIPQKVYGDAPFAIAADPESNSPGAFTYTSSNLKVATITGKTITITGAGTTTITATQGPSGPYVSGSIQISFVVGLNGLTHSVISNKQLITGLDGSAPTSGIYYIPPYINGLDVTELNTNLFKNKTGFTSIILPNTLTGIYNSAFEGCTGLTSMSIPSSVTFIGDTVFKDCTSLQHVNIPAGITSISSNLFYNCTSLPTIILPSSIVNISVDAFNNCRQMTTIVLPDNINNIGAGAFLECIALTSILLPKNLASLGLGAFKNCSSLTEITIVPKLTTLSASVFEGCAGLKTLTIPGTITTIQTNACNGCTGITGSVSIPPSVVTIATGAFNGCNAITEFVFLNNYVNTISSSFTNVTTIFKAIAITTGWSGISINGIQVATSNSLSGLTLVAANLASKDLSNINMSNVDLSGSNLSGVVFSPNTNLSGANFSNVNILGANISQVTFEPLQKIQLLKNINNREINQIIIPNISGEVINSIIKDVVKSNIANAVFDVIIPNANVPFIPSSTTTNGFYIPLFDGETININGIVCFSNINGIYNNQTGQKVDYITVNNRRFTLYFGSVVGVNNPLDTYMSGSVYMSDVLNSQNYKSKWNVSGNDINRPTGNVNISHNLQVSGLFRGNLIIPNKNDIINPVNGQVGYDNTGKLYIFNGSWLSVQLST